MAVKKNILTIAADSGGTSSGSGAGGGGYSTLQYGSSGASVKELQQTLNRLGYNVGAADGIFGNNTKNAVLQYQRDNGLTADGIVGANTWGALNTPVTPKSTPAVDYAGIIADLDKQQAGFQNAAAPTAAQRVQTATGGTVNVSPGELRAEKQAPTVTAKTEAALAEKKAGTSGAVTDSGKNSGIPSTAGVKPTAVAYNDGGIDYKAVTDAAAAKLGLPDLPAAAPTEEKPPVTAEDIIRYYDAQTGASGGTQTAPAAPAAQPVTAAEMLAYSDAQGGTGEAPSGSRYDTPAVLDTAPSGYTPPERNPYYEPNYQRILQEMENYPAFSYDPNSDPVWASISKQYRREGQRATQDTLGQYAAMTGGIPSTAAVTAATQAGDYYGAQLTDRLQSVYNDAYQKYLDQYTRMMGIADQYRSGMDFEEGQFTGDRNFGFNQYTDSRNFDYDKYLNERNFQYQQEQDSYSRGRNAMEDAQNRVAAYLSMGGDPANLDAEIVRQSGYSAAEMQQMRSYYAQQAALQAAKASGSGGGGGGRSGGGSSGSGTTSDYLGRAYASGATDYGTALSYFLASGISSTAAKELATYYAETYYPGMRGASGDADIDVTKLSEGEQAQVVSNLRKMYPGGVIDSDDWRVVTQEFDPQWLAANGFSERSMKGEYNAEANQPTAEYNIGTAIEKAASNYGAAKDFLTRNGASQSVINGLRKQSSLGLDNDAYKQYLRDYIDGFLNGFTTPSYNQTVNDLAAANPQVSGDVLSMLYTPTR